MAAKPRAKTTRATNSRRTSPRQRRDQQVLNVTVRAQQAVRQRQQQMFGVVSKALLMVGLATGIFFGARWAVASLLLKNPEYNILDLKVETDGSLSPDAILAAADLHKGANIFLVSLSRAQARVEAIPQVEKARVIRQLPSHILIQVNERKPVAWIAPEHGADSRDQVTASKSSFLMDAHGLLWQPRKLLSPDYFLPIIRGYSGGPRADGQEADGEEVRAALDLLRAEQESPLAARFQIQEIDLSKHFGIEATDRAGLQVLFPLDDLDKQLKRLELHLQTLDQGADKPHTINLVAERNVPVTFYPSPTPAPSPPAAGASPSPSPGGGHEKEKGSETGNHKEHSSSGSKHGKGH